MNNSVCPVCPWPAPGSEPCIIGTWMHDETWIRQGQRSFLQPLSDEGGNCWTVLGSETGTMITMGGHQITLSRHLQAPVDIGGMSSSSQVFCRYFQLAPECWLASSATPISLELPTCEASSRTPALVYCRDFSLAEVANSKALLKKLYDQESGYCTSYFGYYWVTAGVTTGVTVLPVFLSTYMASGADER